ncbi:MAG: class I SAM-dependent methyltransferase [Planctomycetota bacterium]
MEFSADILMQFMDATTGREARPMLFEALRHTEQRGQAIDLGCGPGNDVLELLKAGFHVLATDGHVAAIERTRERADDAGFADRLTTRLARFAQVHLEPNSADLIHAGFALPFTTVAEFDHIWTSICTALRPGAVFAGQFFGVKDDWAHDEERSELRAFTRAEVDNLLQAFEICHFEEVDRDGETATGTEKHWHVFHVVARRPRDPA